MVRRIATVTGLIAAASTVLLADFSYQETTKITGGLILSTMKVAGVFSKEARQAGQPIQSTVAVKGDRMVHRGPNHGSIIDLGAQTITMIDFQKKTYSVMTFDEMKQALDRMAQKMHEKNNGADMNFRVSANPTGKAKQVAGFEAKEIVLTMVMEGTDQKSGQKGSMSVAVDSWIAPAVPGYDEVRGFYRRMAEKINWTPGGNMFMSRPDVAQGMAEAYKEMAKLDGMPVFQTTVMGAEGTAPIDRSDQPAATQQQSDKPSTGSVLGGAIRGRFGLGGKKQPDAPPPSQSNTGSGTLAEMTTELAGFSSSPVDASQFEIPAGFQKVESDLKRGMQ
jgi:hypothetical protein